MSMLNEEVFLKIAKDLKIDQDTSEH